MRCILFFMLATTVVGIATYLEGGVDKWIIIFAA